jgi:hypothetical protein
VERIKATTLVEDMLQRLEHADEWPLDIVREVHVFGSYARGAEQPGDVDLAVDLDHTDQRWGHHLIACLSSGRDPYTAIRMALVGRRRRRTRDLLDRTGTEDHLAHRLPEAAHA